MTIKLSSVTFCGLVVTLFTFKYKKSFVFFFDMFLDGDRAVSFVWTLGTEVLGRDVINWFGLFLFTSWIFCFFISLFVDVLVMLLNGT